MSFWGILFVGVLAFFVIAFVMAVVTGVSDGNKSFAAGEANGMSASDILKHGSPNANMVCPHCQTKGRVLTKQITRKAGISGGKATGALLTGGVSLLATGLSRKEALTEAHCVNCSSTWHF